MSLDLDNSQKWFFILANGARNGPVNASFIKFYIKSGDITPATLVWTEGKEGWLPLKDTELHVLIKDVVLPPPLPSRPTE